MQILHDSDLMDFMGSQESQYFIKPSELKFDVVQRIENKGDNNGDLLPWSKAQSFVRFRPGEVSLWCGINGHGKSQLLGQVCAWNLRYKKWLIASMEMLPASTMARMSRQTAGCHPSESYINDFLNWTDDKLWIYDQTESVKTERILAMVLYAATKIGINHIVIDSLIKCSIRKDDHNRQVEFVNNLCWAAKKTGCHIHLVHHVRKGDDEGRVPTKFDVRGAGELTDLVDNVFIIHRNIKKEEKIRLGQEVEVTVPDCLLIVAKQRNFEWEGRIALWFLSECLQYVGTPSKKNMIFEL